VIDPSNPLKPATFAVAWPCAGIESLLIFTVVVLLFLKRMPISLKAKVGYFAVGAAVTYFINILRIVSIYQVALSGGDYNFFHSTIGPLYAIPWIVLYPLVILGTQNLWHRFANRKKPETAAQDSEGSLTEPTGVSG
jgi:exosortase/archaeosortase family protein